MPSVREAPHAEVGSPRVRNQWHALGRNDWLFLGGVAAHGAVMERMADLLTLVSSALRNDLDV